MNCDGKWDKGWKLLEEVTQHKEVKKLRICMFSFALRMSIILSLEREISKK